MTTYLHDYHHHELHYHYHYHRDHHGHHHDQHHDLHHHDHHHDHHHRSGLLIEDIVSTPLVQTVSEYEYLHVEAVIKHRILELDICSFDMEAVPYVGDFSDLDDETVPDVGVASNSGQRHQSHQGSDTGGFSSLDVEAVSDVGVFSDLEVEAVPDGEFEDLGQLVPRAKVRVAVPLPPGIHRHSVVWVRILAQRRWEGAKKESSDAGLKKGFNLFPLRVGDHAPLETPASTSWTHGNTYDTRGLLKVFILKSEKARAIRRGRRALTTVDAVWEFRVLWQASKSAYT